VIGLALTLGLALLPPLASSHPDGLERVAEDQGFADRAQDAPYEIIADYLFPGIKNQAIATVLAGVVGIGVMSGLGFGLAWILRRRTGQIAS